MKRMNLRRNRDLTLAGLTATGAIEIEWCACEEAWKITIETPCGCVVLLAPSLDIDLELDLRPQRTQAIRLVDGEGSE